MIRLQSTGNVRRLLALMAAIFALCAPKLSADDSPQLSVSLITCDPGPEIFELYGHQALRVHGDSIDEVYNYGLFDFSSPGFVARFVKGQTDYMSGYTPLNYFLWPYVNRGSRVTSRRLNLTAEEARKLHDILRRNAAPENCVYRYKYVTNNCATRVLDDIDEALGAPVEYPDLAPYATFRDEMRSYNRNYPWYQFGIDLALGSYIDRRMTPRQKMYVPVELDKAVAKAKRPDGKPLAGPAEILYPGAGDVTLAATPFLLTPLFWACVVLIFTLLLVIRDLRRCSLTRWAYSLWFALCGLAGLLVWFLAFFSDHEGAAPNILVWWLNPLCLCFAVMVWLPKARRLLSVAATAWSIAVGVLLVTSPLAVQSFNAAFYPLLLATLLLSITCTIITSKQS